MIAYCFKGNPATTVRLISIKSTQSNVQSGPMLTQRAQSGAAGQLFARVRVEGEVEALSFLLSAHRGSWVSACRR